MIVSVASASRPTPRPAQPDEADVKRSLPGKIKDVFLDGVRASTDFLDRHPVLEATVGDAMAVSRGLHAFPKFIYPTITGATPQEREFILDVLDSLPLKDVNTVKSLEVVPDIPDASGLAFRHTVTNQIQLSREQISIRPEWFREVLIHEVGHTKDYNSAWFNHPSELGGNHSSREPWGAGPYVTEYSGKSHYEDYAESYAKYHVDPERLREANPEKYALIEKHEQQSFMERLIDREEFRETGRWIGENAFPNQGLRTGVEVFYWATGGLQALVGWDQLRKASETDDPHHHMSGVLNLTAGVLFGSQLLAVAGMGVQGAHRALNGAIARGEISAADGDAAVRTFSDPVEMGVRWAGSKLGLMDKFEKLETNGLTAKRGEASFIGVGGAAGALVGGMAGPYGGLMAGYHLAGPMGGAVGLVVGALAGYALGASLGGRAGGALARGLGV
ncbi:MAG: hypothetical protein AMXMBFR33_50650 [Candidatus Xenobia bacterium]